MVHNPETFFRTRPGLCVWSRFRSDVVAKAGVVEGNIAFKARMFELEEDMRDTELEGIMPKGYLFDETGLCALLMRLLSLQADGRRGELLHTGYGNLFYLEPCVVDVSWFADERAWYIRTWRRNGVLHGKGDRVFIPLKAE